MIGDSPGELLVVHETAAVTDQVPELGQLQPPPEAPGDPGLVLDLGLGLHAVEVVAHHHPPGLQAPAVIVQVQQVGQQLQPQISVAIDDGAGPKIKILSLLEIILVENLLYLENVVQFSVDIFFYLCHTGLL